MKNLISWFEIPVVDLSRAISFYSTILEVEIQKTEMFESKMGFFATDGKNVSGALVQAPDYVPSQQGVLVYLNGGNDLQEILDRIASNNGKIIVPKTQISPEMGYFGIFLDTELNKIALHSNN